MSEIYNPSEMFSSNALISSMDEYKNKYQRSLDDPDGFWGEEAEQFIWFPEIRCTDVLQKTSSLKAL